MIIGYQIRNQQNEFWGDGNANTVLSSELALLDLFEAITTSPENTFSMHAVLNGDIESPICIYTKDEPLNTDEELLSFAAEFDGETALSNPTDIASLPTIKAARRLVQRSTADFTVVIPDNVDCLWAGDGSGEWIPGMIFIPNNQIWS